MKIFRKASYWALAIGIVAYSQVHSQDLEFDEDLDSEGTFLVEEDGLSAESAPDLEAFDAEDDEFVDLESDDSDADFGEEGGDDQISFEDFEKEGADDEVLSELPLEDGIPLPEIIDDIPTEPAAPAPIAPLDDPISEPGDFETPQDTDEAITSVIPSEDPDYEYEAKLHSIYQDYHSQKMPMDQWQALVGERRAETYRIQAQDSLWGISQVLFNDGNYWPKIWSVNQRIGNPHLIRPGNAIQFLLGTEAEPPAFAVTEDVPSGGAEDSPSGLPQVMSETENQVEIPPPLTTYRPVLKNVPSSLPEWQNANRTGQYDKNGVHVDIRVKHRRVAKVDFSTYIVEKSPLFEGKISELETGGQVAADFQYVFVRLKNSGSVGDTFLVEKDSGPLIQATSEVNSENLGRRIDVLGEIKLVQRLEAKEKAGGELWRAMVTRSLDGISVGSGVSSGQLSQVDLTEEGPRSNIVAQVIGGAYGNRQVYFGEKSIVFLNRGSRSGLEVGQTLALRANQNLVNPETQVRENLVPIGYLKVIHTDAQFSTGVVTKSFNRIQNGDLTGTGEVLASNALGSEDEDFGKDLDDEFGEELDEDLNSNLEKDLDEASFENEESDAEVQSLGEEFASEDEENFDLEGGDDEFSGELDEGEDSSFE